MRLRLLIFFFFPLILSAQHKPLLYDFVEIPQSLLLNPATETNYKFHVGVPLLSGVSSYAAISGFVLSDVFAASSEDINTKIQNTFNQLEINDHLIFNTQVEVLIGGFRYDEATYLSFGFYQELDGVFYFPKDIMTLFYEGNESYINKSFSLAQLNFNLDVLGVLHFGMTRKFNQYFTLGGRFKLYSGAFNLNSNNNTGNFTTTNGSNNIYTHTLRNVNGTINTSGLFVNGNYLKDASRILSDSFLGQNLGIGIDAGFTYHFSEQLTVTGSVLDIGFVRYSGDNRSYSVVGNFETSGLNFEYNPTQTSNYVEELTNRFKEDIPSKVFSDSYLVWRPTKLNIGFKYSFGKQIRPKNCYYDRTKVYYSDNLGLQLFTVFRPLHQQITLTGFYKKTLFRNFHAKVAYSFNEYESNNLGLGFSADIGFLNVYGMVENIFKISALEKANSIGFQMGINLVFK